MIENPNVRKLSDMRKERVLPIARVSRYDDDKTDSADRQASKLEEWGVRWSDTKELLPVVADLSVSGAVDLFERPKLGPWLTDEGRDKWDAIAVSTQDRLSRSDLHTFALIYKLLQWNKKAYVVDDPSFDMSTPDGRMIIQARAYAAAKELERIRARTRESHEARKYTRAWAGGVPPYGYRPGVAVIAGKRRSILELDEMAVAVITEMANRVISGDAFVTVAEELIARGVPTSSMLNSVRQGRTPGKQTWTGNMVQSILTSYSTMGYKMTREGAKRVRRPLLDENGEMVRAAPAVLDDEKWAELQSVIASRRGAPRPRRDAAPLRGVVFCGLCAAACSRAYSKGKGVSAAYYRCNKTPRKCPGVSLREDKLVAHLEDSFLYADGDKRVLKRAWTPGDNKAEKLESLRQRIARLERDRDTADYWGDEDEASYRTRMATLRRQRDELRAQPSQTAGWAYTPTGQTYREAWESSSPEERRAMLIARGVRFEIVSRIEYRVVVPGYPETGRPKGVIQ